MRKSFLKHISGSQTASGIFRMLFGYDSPELRREIMDLDFRNPVGLAPGFDSSAEFYNAAAAAGYGFVVIGPLCFTRKEGVKAAVEALRAVPAHNIREVMAGAGTPYARAADATLRHAGTSFSTVSLK